MPTPSEIFLEQLSLIERIIRRVCTRRRMNIAEIEDFEAFAKLRLVENDYAIIAKFKERSLFGTYMTTVISRLLNDYRDQEWGRWRNSAEAKRLGPLAKDLEQLLIRDTHSADEAFEALARKYPDVTREQLEELATHFPTRYRRRFVELEGTACRAAEVRPSGIETRETAAVVSSVLGAFIRELPIEDQRIFQLRFGADMSVPQIAKALHVEMQSIYRRLRTHFGAMRAALEAKGVRMADLAELIGEDAARLDFHLKTGDEDPSNDDGDPDGTPEANA